MLGFQFLPVFVAVIFWLYAAFAAAAFVMAVKVMAGIVGEWLRWCAAAGVHSFGDRTVLVVVCSWRCPWAR